MAKKADIEVRFGAKMDANFQKATKDTEKLVKQEANEITKENNKIAKSNDSIVKSQEKVKDMQSRMSKTTSNSGREIFNDSALQNYQNTIDNTSKELEKSRDTIKDIDTKLANIQVAKAGSNLNFNKASVSDVYNENITEEEKLKIQKAELNIAKLISNANQEDLNVANNELTVLRHRNEAIEKARVEAENYTKQIQTLEGLLAGDLSTRKTIQSPEVQAAQQNYNARKKALTDYDKSINNKTNRAAELQQLKQRGSISSKQNNELVALNAELKNTSAIEQGRIALQNELTTAENELREVAKQEISSLKRKRNTRTKREQKVDDKIVAQTQSILESGGVKEGSETDVKINQERQKIASIQAGVYNRVAKESNKLTEEEIRLAKQKEAELTKQANLIQKNDSAHQKFDATLKNYTNTIAEEEAKQVEENENIRQAEENKVNITQQYEQKRNEILTTYNEKNAQLQAEEKSKLNDESIKELDYRGRRLEKTFNAITKILGKLGTKAVSIFKKMTTELGKTGKKALDLSKAVRNIVQYGIGMRSLYYLVRKLRSGFADGVEYLGDADEEVKKLVDSCKELMYYLKAMAAAALQPIMPLVTTYLPLLVEKINSISVAIANMLATWTGADSIKVATTNLEDYANALDTASSSNDKWAKSLGAYDKLNLIQDDTTTKTSKTDVDASNWFTTQPTEINPFIEQIKAFIDGGEFDRLGTLLGDKLKSMFDGINWDFIQIKIQSIVQNATTFLHGLLSTNGLGSTLGDNLAGLFNSMTLSINTFLQTFPWSNFRHVLITGINTLLTNIDAKSMGEALNKLITELLTTANALLTGTNTEQLNKDIGAFFEGFNFSSIVESLKTFAKNLLTFIGTELKALATSNPELFGIGSAVIGALGLIKGADIANSLITFFSGNQQTLGSVLTKGIKNIFGGVDLGGALSSVLGTVGSGIGGLFTGENGLLAGIGSFMDTLWNGGSVLEGFKATADVALSGLSSSLQGLWGVISANPIGALVVALTALAAAFIYAWNTDDEFKQSVIDLWENSIKPLWENLKAAALDIWENSLKPLWENLQGLFTDIMEALKPVMEFIVLTVVPKIVAIVQWLLSVLQPIFKNIISIIDNVVTVLRGVIQFISGVFTGNWEQAWQGIQNIFSGIWNGLINILKVPINVIIGIINGLISGITSGINNLLAALNSFHIDVPQWVTDLTGVKTFGFNFGMLTAPQIPYLAQGAVIPPNSKFLAMLGDQTHGTNVEAPLDTIKQAVAEVMAQMGGSQSIVLNLDGKTVAKVVWDENQKKYKQLGKVAYNG